MRILLAPDSFKGSLSGPEAAVALQRGLQQCNMPPWPKAQFKMMPLADGGEGTADTLVQATGGQWINQQVTGPLGDAITARFGMLGDGQTAIVEMALASGLELLASHQLDPSRTTSRGTGELIRSALDAGCKRLIVAIGGSATNDGGMGMASALGVKFYDDEGNVLPDGGGVLGRLKTVDMQNIDARLATVDIVVAYDVDNPLLGERGATHVYAPQKGANAAMVDDLERGMRHYARIVERTIGRTIAMRSGAGAAGGLGFAFMAFCNATLQPGFSIVSEIVKLPEAIRQCDVVITGEGRIDSQTMHGKVVAGVGRLAKQYEKPVIAVAGDVAYDADDLIPHFLTTVVPIVPAPYSLHKALEEAPLLLEKTAQRIAALISIGGTLKYRRE